MSATHEQPDAFGEFEVRAELSAGPSGKAYLAYDARLNLPVVVCTTAVRGRRKDAAIVDALQALCAADVTHPNIARPLASGIEAGTPYIVYAHIPGVSVQALLEQNGPQSPRDIVDCLTPVAAAVDFAASLGMHHGALTPADIIVEDEKVVVTRFGLVDALTGTGLSVAVQQPHASPERLAGAAPTMADDVHSLAAVALTMLEGVTQDQRTSRGRRKSLDSAESTPPLTPSEEETLRTAVGVDASLLRQAMSRASSGTPSMRQSTATEFVDELRRALVQEEVSAETGRIIPVALVVAVLTAGVWFAGSLLDGTRGEQSPAPAPQGATPQDSQPPPASPPAAVTVPSDASKESAAPEEPAPARPTPAPPRATPATPGRNAARAARTNQRPRAATTPPAAAAETGPGALLASSTPPGAQLFVDGVLVGTTPLLLPGVTPGPHAIRLELAGFQPWSSSVEIAPNQRYRLTVNLEQ